MPAVQSVHRALAILQVLAKSPTQLGPTALADELWLAKSTVHRLLSALEEAQFVVRTGRGHYRVGPAVEMLRPIVD